VHVSLPQNALLRVFLAVDFEPLVVEGLLGCEPFLWLGDEFLDEVPGLLGNLVPLLALEVELSFLHGS